MSKLTEDVRKALANAAGELLELRDGRQFFGKTTRKWLAALCSENEALELERDEWREAAKTGVGERERAEWQDERDAAVAAIETLERERDIAREAANSLHASHAASLAAMEGERQAKERCEALEQERREWVDFVAAAAENRPMANGEYPHLVHCSGNRHAPTGSPGCVCDNRYKSLKAQHAKAVEAAYREGWLKRGGETCNCSDCVAAAWLSSNAKKQLERGQ